LPCVRIAALLSRCTSSHTPAELSLPAVTLKPSIFTCPRCLLETSADAVAAFCPRCGLPSDAANDGDEVRALKLVSGEGLLLGSRLAYGDIANLYRCTVAGGDSKQVFKIARTHLANSHLAAEYETLKQLIDADPDRLAAPFLPQPMRFSAVRSNTQEPMRAAEVLGFYYGINGPDELYSLDEVRAAYPDGIDARDMAWMWRRLLSVLTFVHWQKIVHGAVTPEHVLIEPREHKLVLIGWCGAVPFGKGPKLISQRWRNWSNWENRACPATDLAAAAKSMAYLLRTGEDPSIVRHLELAQESASDASRLLAELDKTFRGIWGPPEFREFSMPPRTR
jgi:hypothetical protein